MHIWTHLKQAHPKNMKAIHLYDTCKNCKSFQSKSFITQHVESCLKYFKYVSDNRCTLCLEEPFKTMRSAYHHIEQTHKNDNKDVLYEKNRYKIQEASQKIKGTTKTKFCKHCLADRTNLWDHVKKCAKKSVHVNEKNTCKLCYTEFRSREMAIKHVGFAHRALIYKNVDGNRFKTLSSSTTNSNDAPEETIEDVDDKFNPLEFLKEEPMDIEDEPSEQIEISNVISKVNIRKKICIFKKYIYIN